MRNAFLVLTCFSVSGHSRSVIDGRENGLKSEVADKALRSFTALLFAQNPMCVGGRASSHQRHALQRRCTPSTILRMLLEPPADDLRPIFDRGEEAIKTKKSFTPDADPVHTVSNGPNQQLIEEIRELQRANPSVKAPEKKTVQEVDLNGIEPLQLILGAALYGATSVLALQFIIVASEFFETHPMDDSLYFVQRLSGIGRGILIAIGGLGATSTLIAALGQLALAGKVQMGIMKGELDPKAKRVDSKSDRRAADIQKILGFMMGNKDAGK